MQQPQYQYGVYIEKCGNFVLGIDAEKKWNSNYKWGKKCRALKLEGETKFCPKKGCHSAIDP